MPGTQERDAGKKSIAHRLVCGLGDYVALGERSHLSCLHFLPWNLEILWSYPSNNFSKGSVSSMVLIGPCTFYDMFEPLCLSAWCFTPQGSWKTGFKRLPGNINKPKIIWETPRCGPTSPDSDAARVPSSQAMLSAQSLMGLRSHRATPKDAFWLLCLQFFISLCS